MGNLKIIAENNIAINKIKTAISNIKSPLLHYNLT